MNSNQRPPLPPAEALEQPPNNEEAWNPPSEGFRTLPALKETTPPFDLEGEKRTPREGLAPALEAAKVDKDVRVNIGPGDLEKIRAEIEAIHGSGGHSAT